MENPACVMYGAPEEWNPNNNIYNGTSKVRKVLSVFMLLLPLSGCILLLPLPPEPEPFQEDRLVKIEIGHSTKIDVQNIIGWPKEEYSNWFIYFADRYLWQWYLVFIFEDFSLHEVALSERGSKVYTLLIKFDGDNIVEKVVVVTDDIPCNEDETVCYPSDLFGEEIVQITSGEIPDIYLTDFEPNFCQVTPELPAEQSFAVGSALFIQKRYREAYVCYLRVAGSYTAWAQLRQEAYLKLGIMSELGWGTEPNLNVAKSWLQKAGIL